MHCFPMVEMDRSPSRYVTSGFGGFQIGSKILTKTTPEALIAYFKVYFKENLVPTLFFYTSTHWGL